MFENLKNKNSERFKDDVPKNVSAKKIREQNEETYDELSRIIPSIQEGVSPISIKPTTPLTELNALPNAVYRAFGEGTYQFNPTLQIVQGSAVNVIPSGYSVKFLKDVSGWSVSVVEKLPQIQGTDNLNPIGDLVPKERAVADYIIPLDKSININEFNPEDTTQTRVSSARTFIINRPLRARMINFINLRSPLDGTLIFYILTKNLDGTFNVKKSKTLQTSRDKVSYNINESIANGDYIGAYVSWNYVLATGSPQKDNLENTLTLIGQAASTNNIFQNLGEKVKVSFTMSPIITDVENKLNSNISTSNELYSKTLDNGFNNYNVNSTTEGRTSYPRTVIFDQVLKAGTLRYVEIHKCLNGIALMCALSKNTDGTFKVERTQRIELFKDVDYYSINLPIADAEYFGVYFRDFGYVIDTTATGLLNTYVYNGDPTAISSITATDIGDKVKVSFGYYYSINKKVDNINQVIPVDAKIRKGGDTLLNTSAIGSPLYIKDPYGYNQFLHPNIQFFENGWNRYKYWMAVTPMPMDGAMYADRYENPCIYVSNDGISWFVYGNAINPIDDLIAENIANKDYMSDPCLVYRKDLNRLECWYRITYAQQNNKTLILRKYTTDGVNWSEREVMIDTTVLHMVRSQAIIWDGTKYRMWYTGGEQGSVVSYNESTDGKNWNNYKVCNGIPSCWHLDILIVNGKYYLTNYELNENAGINRLVLHESTDGINFTSGNIILDRTFGTWYSESLYKSSLIYVNGMFILYFSGWKTRRYVGLAMGKDPYKLEVQEGNYSVGVKSHEGLIRLINTPYRETMIEVSDKGHKLGFDYDQEIIYVQRPDGSRKVLFSLK